MFIIKQDIAKLNKQIAHLQNHVKEHTSKTASNSKQALEHSSNVVVMLQSRLAAQTSTFKDVLELRTENMKATKDRREQFMFTTQQQSNTFSSMSLSAHAVLLLFSKLDRTAGASAQCCVFKRVSNIISTLVLVQ